MPPMTQRKVDRLIRKAQDRFLNGLASERTTLRRIRSLILAPRKETP